MNENVATSAESILKTLLDTTPNLYPDGSPVPFMELVKSALSAARVIHGLPAEGETPHPGYIPVSDLEGMMAANSGTVITKNQLRSLINATVRTWADSHDSDSP